MEVLALRTLHRFHHILYISLDFEMLPQIFHSYDTAIILHINHMDLPMFSFKLLIISFEQPIIYLSLSLIAFLSLLIIKEYIDMDDN